MKIVLIGSGNTATVLGKKIFRANHTIVQVYSRNHQHAADLAKEVNAEAVSSYTSLTDGADIYIIAVSDMAVAEVVNELKPGKKVVVHTAGSVSMNVLKNASLNYGVLYPLQSLRKEMKRIPEIPFLIDGCTPDIKALLYDFAGSLSTDVQFCNDDQRLHMHLAAVITSNFTNHLYALTEKFCGEHQLSFQLLVPLITEVAERLKEGNAVDMQTGPARRGDDVTIQKHLQLLKNEEQLQQLYLQLSESIRNMYTKNKNQGL